MSTAQERGTRPYIVGLGGTLRPNSSTESALRIALQEAQSAGAQTELFGGSDLARLPMYDPESDNVDEAVRLVEALRRADGVIIASPGYHGSVSGLVKNALDYLEDLRDDDSPYLSGRAVGCVTTAYGWQAAVTTLQTLRSIVHALRGWPTPLGAAINSATTRISYGEEPEERVGFQLRTVGREVCMRSTAAQPLTSAATGS
ncbi:NAD(P)H-dependent oxidoreductase [Mycobacterium sp. CBMA293]|uniref:NADPH-dependent FMN reductase n=1 Tax=unclassified Mycolicibacterium TaxID=2636767 RepID=UPI00132C4354|nr:MULTISPECIES: NAD(P)H-dependent oxidoreductase [unclassified Mycolicibacterium]MUL46093.1 NAD(P)H-dependent oxidoreductase [Mycolicibacterium sp. CBMA 360]MUL94216.1 NAD(P)H-dependent oxidoreductase [Mycolicibacterium sp. CBMA 230]MUM31847.1 NAD(P)H-dependent oxidoreductase [Mycolicibacterium sp. CBMA 361]MUL58858.1 NAD(P)H-dependent oxidoreductase [Mycolicibacterium sp. CBMA 335]MUL69252.1 NAD(P)H-dependent oxidoreductase [Mycolicibacterium sp. CBMA 311]